MNELTDFITNYDFGFREASSAIMGSSVGTLAALYDRAINNDKTNKFHVYAPVGIVAAGFSDYKGTRMEDSLTGIFNGLVGYWSCMLSYDIVHGTLGYLSKGNNPKNSQLDTLKGKKADSYEKGSSDSYRKD